MERFFPKEKIVFTGNPVRTDIYGISKRDEGMAYYGLDPNKKVIAILGGSLGARTLNQAMEQNADLIGQRDDVQVLWQCGKIYEQQFKDGRAAGLPNVRLQPFIDRMDLAYSVADVVIARSGALTISELCLVGKPSVLVPSPNVAEDHQTKNAQALVDKGAALMVRDADAAEQMLPTALALLSDASRADSLRRNIASLGRPTAADDIARTVMGLATTKTS
jgi:UDP-N-acetylglucosamine--N-acetylmuramyl-(pentapeptide) pyrophosphoryl-undecaprenol N-acetylglucosamine transferase